MALDVKLAEPDVDLGLGPAPREEGDNFRIPTGRGVLTAAEIEALLRPDIPEDAFEEPSAVAPLDMVEIEAEPQGLDFDAGLLASRLTLALRQACQIDAVVKVMSAQKAPLSHLVSQHVGEPVLILFSDQTGMQVAGLTLDNALAARIIEQSCGGVFEPERGAPARAFSPLDGQILMEMLGPLATALDPSFSVACIEADRSAAHAMLPPGKAMLAECSCEIAGAAGKAAFARLDGRADIVAREGMTDQLAPAARLSTTLTVRLASLRVPLSRLTDLKAGSVLLLGLPTDQPVELLSGGHQGDVVAEGDIGRKGNRIAVRISKRKPGLLPQTP